MPHDLASVLLAHSGLARRLRFAHMRFAVEDSALRHDILLNEWSVVHESAPIETLSTRAQFTLSAASSAWSEYARPMPAPGFHDVVAMIECGHAKVRGDLLPFFRDLFLVKGLASILFRGEVRW